MEEADYSMYLLLTAVLMGIMPGLGTGWVSAAVGYITVNTGHAFIFTMVFAVLFSSSFFAMYLASTFDIVFDASMPSRYVYAFRFSFGAIVLALSIIFLGELLAGMQHKDNGELPRLVVVQLLAVVAVIGFCFGSLTLSAGVVLGGIKRKHVILQWIGFSCSGVLCIISVAATGFSPSAPEHVVRTFFYHCSGFVSLCMAILAVTIFRGELDDAFEGAAMSNVRFMSMSSKDSVDSATPRPQRPWTWQSFVAPAQGLNSFMNMVTFLLLPLLCSQQLAQNLALWKMGMEVLSPCVLYLYSMRMEDGMEVPAAVPVVAVMIRVPLVAWLWFLMFLHMGPSGCDSSILLLLIAWDMVMIIGSGTNVLADLASRCSVEKGLKVRNVKLFHMMGNMVGLVVGALATYMMSVEKQASVMFMLATQTHGSLRQQPV